MDTAFPLSHCVIFYLSLSLARIHITYYTPHHTHYTLFIPYTYTDNKEARQQAEQTLELEEYVRIREECFANQIAEAELQKTATQEVHKEEK